MMTILAKAWHLAGSPPFKLDDLAHDPSLSIMRRI
jgi:hypothetical protein